MESQWATVEPIAASASLEEMSPRHGWRSFWMNVILSEIVLVLLPGGMICLFARERLIPALPVFGIAMLIALPIALLCARGQNAYLRSKSGWVKCSDGVVSTIVGADIQSAPLDRCRWYHGSSTRATAPVVEGNLVTGFPAILIEFPHECQTEHRDARGKRMPGGPVIVAVGFDEEIRKSWREVLDESGAVHDVQRERMPSPLSESTVAVLAFFVVPLCLTGTIRGWIAIERALVGLGVAANIAEAICLPLFFPGVVFVLFYGFLLFRLYQKRFCVTQEQREATMEPVQRYKYIFAGTLPFALMSPLFDMAEDPIANTLQIAATLLLTGLVTWHFSYLLKEPARATTD